MSPSFQNLSKLITSFPPTREGRELLCRQLGLLDAKVQTSAIPAFLILNETLKRLAHDKSDRNIQINFIDQVHPFLSENQHPLAIHVIDSVLRQTKEAISQSKPIHNTASSLYLIGNYNKLFFLITAFLYVFKKRNSLLKELLDLERNKPEGTQSTYTQSFFFALFPYTEDTNEDEALDIIIELKQILQLPTHQQESHLDNLSQKSDLAETLVQRHRWYKKQNKCHTEFGKINKMFFQMLPLILEIPVGNPDFFENNPELEHFNTILPSLKAWFEWVDHNLDTYNQQPITEDSTDARICREYEEQLENLEKTIPNLADQFFQTISLFRESVNKEKKACKNLETKIYLTKVFEELNTLSDPRNLFDGLFSLYPCSSDTIKNKLFGTILTPLLTRKTHKQKKAKKQKKKCTKQSAAAQATAPSPLQATPIHNWKQFVKTLPLVYQPEKGEYAQRVMQWFRNPEEALQTDLYNYLNDAQKLKAKVRHTVPLFLDALFGSRYAFKATDWQASNGSLHPREVLPIEIFGPNLPKMRGGMFKTHDPQTKICYHRCVTIEEEGQFANSALLENFSWDNIDFPSLESQPQTSEANHPTLNFQTQNYTMTLEPNQTITIVEKTTQITFRVFALNTQ